MKHDQQNSPFVILGVDEDCTDDDVKKAYRRMVMRWHPDRSALPDADTHFKRVQVAYQLLRDESGRSMVLNIIKMRRQPRPPGFNTPPNDFSGSGHKEFDANYYSSPNHFNQGSVWSFFYVIAYSLLLKVYLAVRLERLPMNVSATMLFAMVAHSKYSTADGFSNESFVSLLLLGLVAGVCADFTINFAKTTSRYRMRSLVNNIVGYTVLLSAACFIWSVDFGGFALLPDMIGLDGELVRNSLLFILVSCFYAWFVFCFLFQSHNAFYETVLVWLWVFSAEYFVIVELGI